MIFHTQVDMFWCKQIEWRRVSHLLRVAKVPPSAIPLPHFRCLGSTSAKPDFSNKTIERENQQSKQEQETHFSVLNVEQQFDLDLHVLEKRFKDLQRLYHPDKYANAPQVRLLRRFSVVVTIMRSTKN